VEARSLKFAAAACGGKLLAGPPEKTAARVCTDSRAAQAGDLFFAIKGGRFDGHDFLDEVAGKGAAAVVIARDRQPKTLPACAVIAVDDPRAALGKFAAAHRAEFDLPVVAVGGSNGKTSTKELLAAVLRQKFVTLWSEASFNNDIGVPLTLARLERSHQAAVVEVGTNHPGELAPLVEMARPRFGVITNIGREHLEFFGDVAGVAAEEGRLAELLPADGKLFLNGDDAWTDKLAQRTRAKVVRAGFGRNSEWRAGAARFDQGGMSFEVIAPDANYSGGYHVNLLGHHQVANALLAVAAGAELGVGREEIRRGLAECPPAKMRLQLWEVGGVAVLDDSYNANADSVLAALRVLSELPCKGRRVAVLGDMAELGAAAAAAHAEAGHHAAEWRVEQLFAVGKMAGVMAGAARAAGLSRVLEFGDVESAARAAKSFLRAGDVVLLKASRAMKLERVAEVLKPETGGR
jgi:UDP-N-acetylmuramoyl-tripeptide--D-alanyl-D-alanine ligase